MVQMLSCLVRSLDVASLKDDDLTILTNVGGSGCVLTSCVAGMCMLYARVCCMSVALEMIPQCSYDRPSLSQLFERVRDMLSDATKVTCLNVAIACGGGVVYRGIVASTHLALNEAQLPAHICECIARSVFCYFSSIFPQLKLPPLLLHPHLFEILTNMLFRVLVLTLRFGVRVNRRTVLLS
jgi:hypothetical protein